MAEAKTDKELLLAWSEGDQKAGNELFQRHFDSISRFFFSKVGPGPDCDDLIQETFYGCLQGLDRFRGDSSVRNFLFGIAKHKLFAYYEQRASARKRFDPRTISLHDLGVSPFTASVSCPEHKLLLQALKRLPLETQTMIELHYWEGLQYVEIAEVFEVSIATVKNRLYKGRRDLEGFIDELGRRPELIQSTIEGLERWARETRRAVPTGVRKPRGHLEP